MVMLLVMSLFPYFSAVLAAVLAPTGVAGPSGAATDWFWILGCAGFVIAMQQSLLVRYYRLSYASPWLAPTFILGAVVCVGMLLNAMLKLNGRTATTWRGTTYRGNEVATPSP
jgi:hypothetical protein